jgi:hypothetical protein
MGYKSLARPAKDLDRAATAKIVIPAQSVASGGALALDLCTHFVLYVRRD